jgi:hypothetical protein
MENNDSSRDDEKTLSILRRYLDSRALYEESRDDVGIRSLRGTAAGEFIKRTFSAEDEQRIGEAEAARDEMNHTFKLLQSWRRGESISSSA